MIDTELLEKALGAIEAEPESWDQGYWACAKDEREFEKAHRDVAPGTPVTMCETTLCLAGHILVQSGEYYVGVDRHPHDDEPTPVFMHTDTKTPFLGSIFEEGVRLLGIHVELGNKLFTSGESMKYTWEPKAFTAWVRDKVGLGL